MSHKGHSYAASGAFFLDNPIRRLIQPPSELIEKLAINPNDVVVDFGCGPGYFTMELAKKAQSVVAVDLSSEMLEKAQNKAEKQELRTFSFCKATAQAFN
jgi:ubiquinone/menaquinone biosynthesis C-methylase UbiE